MHSSSRFGRVRDSTRGQLGSAAYTCAKRRRKQGDDVISMLLLFCCPISMIGGVFRTKLCCCFSGCPGSSFALCQGMVEVAEQSYK